MREANEMALLSQVRGGRLFIGSLLGELWDYSSVSC